MNLEPIFDPRKRKPAPSPARVDMRTIFLCGTIVFAFLTIGFASVEIGLHREFGYKFWICLFGFILGLALLVWEHFNRSTYMKLANDDETIAGLDGPEKLDGPNKTGDSARAFSKTDTQKAEKRTFTHRHTDAKPVR